MVCIIMKYQKITNLSDNTALQLPKFRTENWVEIIDHVRGTYDTNSQIQFKTIMLSARLCGYSDVCILVKGIIIVVGQWADAAAMKADRNNK